jgi:[calcium/calmodulin-dependent protein kinase] kinase
MKAITKFKTLLAPKGVVAKPHEPIPRRIDATQGGDKATESQSSEATGEATPEQKSNEAADHAAHIIKERERFLRDSATVGPTSRGEKGHAHDPTEFEAPFLGIGTGSRDDFASGDLPPADVVSDSPTAVSFNVYDRAFEAEVDKIKRSTSRKGKGQETGTTVYLTKHLRDEKKFQNEDDPDITWVGDGDSGSNNNGTEKRSAAEKFRVVVPRSGPKFADLVAGAVARAKVHEAAGAGQVDSTAESPAVES